jgi:hypothetical protein
MAVFELGAAAVSRRRFGRPRRDRARPGTYTQGLSAPVAAAAHAFRAPMQVRLLPSNHNQLIGVIGGIPSPVPESAFESLQQQIVDAFAYVRIRSVFNM